MTMDLDREFQLLSDRARQQLKEVPACGSYRPVFSFWAIPSSSPAYRCTVYSPVAKGKPPFASFIIWRRDLDAEKWQSPEDPSAPRKDLAPTMQGDVVWLTERDIEEMQQRIGGISLPVFLPSVNVAADESDLYGFRYDESLFGASLQWATEHPKEWRPFTEAITHIVGQLEGRRKAKMPMATAANGHAVRAAATVALAGR